MRSFIVPLKVMLCWTHLLVRVKSMNRSQSTTLGSIVFYKYLLLHILHSCFHPKLLDLLTPFSCCACFYLDTTTQTPSIQFCFGQCPRLFNSSESELSYSLRANSLAVSRNAMPAIPTSFRWYVGVFTNSFMEPQDGQSSVTSSCSIP